MTWALQMAGVFLLYPFLLLLASLLSLVFLGGLLFSLCLSVFEQLS